MKNEEFQSINVDLNILIRKNDNEVIIISVYVNDFLIANKIIQKINYTKNQLYKDCAQQSISDVRFE